MSIEPAERGTRSPAPLGYQARPVRDDAQNWTADNQYSSGLTLFLVTAFLLGPAALFGAALGVHWFKTFATIVAASAGVALYAGLRHGMWRVALGLGVGVLVAGAGVALLALIALAGR